MESHKYVKKMLRRVAQGEMPSNWSGFDDSDIQWFLHHNKRFQGPGIDALRTDYKESIQKCREAPEITFCLFPITPEQAAQILTDISA